MPTGSSRANGTMSAREYRRSLVRHFMTQGLKEARVYQRRPITVVYVLVSTPDGKLVTNFGVSKVSHPDRWSPKYGIYLAMMKACTNAARDTVAAGDPRIETTRTAAWKHTDNTQCPFVIHRLGKPPIQRRK